MIYSSDNSSSDYHFICCLFNCWRLKKDIKSKPNLFFYYEMHNLAERWNKIAEVQGKYFDGWIIILWIYMNKTFCQKY